MSKSLLSLLLLFPFGLLAQENKKWDVNTPEGSFKELTIETDNGTWMNLDVSPDGTTIVFDLLGDIYSMPISGGTAKLLREGHAYDVQPRFSPDGTKISFTSDAGGGDNIWIMNSDGSGAHQVTKESFRLLNNAIWTPDGQYLIARKHFTSGRSLGAGEMWMYHISGGKGIQLTKRKNDQQDAGEPTISPDGRYLYFSEDVYPGGFFQYNKNPNSQIYIIRRYDRNTGKLDNLISGPGGAFRSQVSPDGKKIAFIRRVRTKTVLYIHEFETGIQTPVFDALSKDQQEAWAIFGVYPNYNWLPDNENVIIWDHGKIKKINTKTGVAENVPFKATATHKITDAVVNRVEAAPDKFNVNVIRNLVTSPDGKTVVFNAAGYLWTKKLPNGKPKRLTKGTDLEYEPSFSGDGSTIVYVTWNDEEKGSIYTIPSKGGTAVKMNTEKGIFRTPTFSKDGNRILYQKERGNGAMGFAYTVKPGMYWMDTKAKNPNFIAVGGSNPTFSADGNRVYFQRGNSFRSVDLQGNDEKTHFNSTYVNQYELSPDNKWLVFSELYHIYVMPFASTGKTFQLSGNSQSLPITKISDKSGINLHWSQDNSEIHWTIGPEYQTVELKDAFTFLEGSPGEVKVERETVDIGFELDSDKPEGTIALTGAKIVTMKGDEIIENGTLVIKENKIVAVGPSGEVDVPNGAKTYDVSGKVIMPGIIDTHAHLRAFRYGLTPQKDWPYYANLAYGITATHDPSSNTEMSLSQSEMVKAGTMVGPRIYSTGTILYGADGDFKAVINSYEDAKFAIERTKAFGAFSVKSYNQPRREQRQQVIKAAKEVGVMVYPEGGSTFTHNMTMILDGHTSIEHNVPVAPLYDDVIKLWGASKTSNTPTLIVNYAGLSGEYYWYQTTNVWEEKKLLKYTPRSVIDARSRHRTMAPMEEYKNGHILTSESCKKLVDAGVKVCVGGHGQLQGLGVIWEMWNLSQGGMTHMEVIRAATLHGAEYIGMGDQLGSLEVGKLADLIVLDKDPTEDIYNVNSVRYTIANGRMFDTETMNEIGNYDNPRTKFFWEQEGYNANFEFHAETNSFLGIHCSCGN